MTAWPAGSLRRASVNSFGYGGANAHTVLESIDHLAPGCGGVQGRPEKDISSVQRSNGHTNGSINTNGDIRTVGNGSNGVNRSTAINGTNGHMHTHRSQFLLPFSAHNESSLKQNMTVIRDVARRYDILDLAYTLGCRRSKLASRAFVVATQDKVAEAMDIESLFISKAIGSREMKLGFVFTGEPNPFREIFL